MVDVEIIRLEKTKDGIIGVLLIDAMIFCYTLEHPKKFIKTGTYRAKFEMSPKFSRRFYELKEVKGRSEILIHVGNTMKDTTGCILIGKNVGYWEGKRAILSSRITVDKFHKELNGKDINVMMLDLIGL
jgi:hypothetical protein